MSESKKLPQFIAAIAVNFGTLCCGMAIGWPSPAAGPLLDSENPALETAIDTEMLSWCSSLICLGAVFGPFAAGFAVDKLGRKLTLLCGAIPFIVAWFVIATTSTVIQVIASRIVMGFGVGIIFTGVPIYVGEISEDSIRGALGSFLQLFLTIGVMISFCVGPYVAFWLLALICMLFPIVYIFLYLFCPESPYYYIAMRNQEAAYSSVKRLRGFKDDGPIKEELKVIQDFVDESERNKGKFTDIFVNKANRKALMLSVGLVAGQQLGGINVVLMYSQSIFKAAGSKLQPEISTMIIGAVQIASSALTPFIIDRLGRKILLLVSAAGMAADLIILGVYFFLKENTTIDISSIGTVPIITLILYISFFSMGYGPIPWAIVGELFSGSIKANAATMTASIAFMFAFLMTKFFVNLISILGFGGSFWIFGGFCIISFIFVLFLLPETKGKSLAEIQEALGG